MYLTRYVFNIKDNNYRLKLNIRFASTHSEYDKIQAKTI